MVPKPMDSLLISVIEVTMSSSFSIFSFLMRRDLISWRVGSDTEYTSLILVLRSEERSTSYCKRASSGIDTSLSWGITKCSDLWESARLSSVISSILFNFEALLS